MTVGELEVGMTVLVGPIYGTRYAAEIVNVRRYGDRQRLVTFRSPVTGDEWTQRQSNTWPVDVAG